MMPRITCRGTEDDAQPPLAKRVGTPPLGAPPNRTGGAAHCGRCCPLPWRRRYSASPWRLHCAAQPARIFALHPLASPARAGQNPFPPHEGPSPGTRRPLPRPARRQGRAGGPHLHARTASPPDRTAPPHHHGSPKPGEGAAGQTTQASQHACAPEKTTITCLRQRDGAPDHDGVGHQARRDGAVAPRAQVL